MKFVATSVEYWSDENVQSVFFGNEKRQLALTLSGVPGAPGHTCEWNDQSNVCANAVKSIERNGLTVEVHLTAKAAQRLGEPGFTITLKCDPGVLDEMTRVLTAIFAKRFRNVEPAGAKKTAPPAPPKKDWSKIRFLDLEGKNLRALPPEVAEMTQLEVARLARNPRLDLHAAFETLSHMPALRELTISAAAPIPDNIGKLTALESLQVTGLTTPHVLPDGIGQLRNLKSILIMSDADVILPDSFVNLAALQDLNVRAPSWQLPPRFDRLRSLTQLDLFNCRLPAVPPDMESMTAVDCIAFGGPDGDFEAYLKAAARMPNLKRIELGINPIPKTIGLCRQIETLVIWAGVDPENPLRLPGEMFDLRQLQELIMSRNCFHEIPEALGRLTGLTTLAINESEFDALPESLGELQNLESLSLSENPFLTTLPESFGKLTRLRSLNLSENPKLARLPDSARHLTNLESVNLRDAAAGLNIPDAWKPLLR